MISLDYLPILLIMFGGMLGLLMLGSPVVFALGGVGTASMFLFLGPDAIAIVSNSAQSMMGSYSLLCVPLYIFMAMILQKIGVIEAMFDSIRLWFGRVGGGLSIAVIFVSTIIAAMSGASSTGTVTMGILALPKMLKLGYNKTIACGPILVGGALGVLVPPSVTLVIYGSLAGCSIGRLFAAGLLPGLILAGIFIIFLAVACAIKPELGPPLPPEERVSFGAKVVSLKYCVLPMLIIGFCLGAIFMGITSPTEAAGLGAFLSLGCAALYRRLNWQVIKEAAIPTLTISCMIMWIMIGAFCFKAVLLRTGATDIIAEFILGLDVSPMTIIIVMLVSFFILGMFLSDVVIMMITFPVYLPIISELGFDLIWFGLLFMLMTQMALLTPPYGMCLFYLKGVAPKEVTLGDITKSIIPFIPLQLLVLILILCFPGIVLWLPDLLFGAQP